MAVAEENQANYQVVLYLKDKLSRADLTQLVERLEDPVEDLVRKDGHFRELGLSADSYVGKPAAVIDVLLAHPRLMQRPVLARGNRAIIGRPKDRVAPFVS